MAIYGAIGSAGSSYDAQLDGEPFVRYNASRPYNGYLPNELIFYADNLSLEEHRIRLTAQPETPEQMLSIDYAIVDGDANAAPSGSLSSGLGCVPFASRATLRVAV